MNLIRLLKSVIMHIIRNVLSVETCVSVITQGHLQPVANITHDVNKKQPANVWMISSYTNAPEWVGRDTMRCDQISHPVMFSELQQRLYSEMGTDVIFYPNNPNMTGTVMLTRYMEGSKFAPHVDCTYVYDGNTYFGVVPSHMQESDMQRIFDGMENNSAYSVVVMLAPCSLGGDLYVRGNKVELGVGDGVIFSIFDIHSVTEILAGERYVLVTRITI